MTKKEKCQSKKSKNRKYQVTNLEFFMLMLLMFILSVIGVAIQLKYF